MGAFLAQFLAQPLFLIGIASAGIPLVIHLIHRRKAPKLPFSTLRFLRVSNERTARRQHLQDIFLLLLRALICALLAIALAQPFLPSSGSSDGPVAAAIVLDNSMSMSAEDEGEARLLAAKEAALAVLAEAGRKARVVLVLTNPPAGKAEPAVTSDLDAVEREIVNTPASVARGSLPASIAKAVAILDEEREPNKQVFVVSDMQKNSWTVAPGASVESPVSKYPVIVVGCGSTETSNTAINDVTIRARSRVEGEPIAIEARLMNYGPRAVKQTATLHLNGRASDRQQITLAPGVPAVVSFSHTFTEPGIHSGYVTIDDDRLKTDNRRSFSLEIRKRIDVLIVEDEKAEVSFMAGSFYLAKALDPLAGQADIRSPIRPVRILTAELPGEDLNNYDALFLVNVGRLEADTAAKLRDYVRAGGGLVIFAGDRVGADHYNEVLADPAAELMPVQFGDIRGVLEDRSEFQRVTGADYTHPLLARFKGEGLFNDVQVYQYVSAEVAGRTATTLLSLADGSPLLVENRFESGNVMMFTTSASDDWSNFPLKQAYLPLLHEIVYYLSRSETAKDTYPAGSPVRLTFGDVREGITVHVSTPEGRKFRVRTTAAEGGCVGEFPFTDRPGIYRWEADKTQHTQGAFAVNPDVRESDLQQTAGSDVEAAGLSDRVYVVSSIDEMRETLARLREGLPLLDYFFMIVLVIAVFECFFSNWLTPAPAPEIRKTSLGFVTGTQANA